MLKSTYIINIFIAYTSKDLKHFEEIFQKLKSLRKRATYRVNLICSDGSELLSTDGREFLSLLIQSSDLILPLMSEDSIFTSFFSGPTLRQAVDLHKKKRLHCIPILLNTCWWEDTAFKSLEVLPRAHLPVFDAPEVKNELLQQVAEQLEEVLSRIQEEKIELERKFTHLVEVAEERFAQGESSPDSYQKAVPLYQEALLDWREGFLPLRETLEARLQICQREIDFRHYALAAQHAFAAKDIETAYFNCKDALELRNDASISKLFAHVSKLRHEENLRHAREPFEQNLKLGHQHFLKLEWQAAETAYRQALEFYEQGFEPEESVIRHKIQICEREFIIEQSERDAKAAENRQQYAKAAQIITEAIERVNHQALNLVKHQLELIQKLKYAQPFRDPHTNRWGYKDTHNDLLLIPAKFMAAYPFQENLAGVKKFDQWGFIDIEGNIVINFEYDYVRSFENGKAEVYRGSEHFFINHKGQRI